MIRRAQPADALALVCIAQYVTSLVDTGDLLISPPRIGFTARRLISDPQSLVLVHERSAEIEGEFAIDGAIAIGVSDGLFFERKIAGIVLWYAETPGSGYAMLRQALQWCDTRPAIKAVGFSADFGMSSRVEKLLARAGLKRRGAVYARY